MAAAGTPVWVPTPSKDPKAAPFVLGEVVTAEEEAFVVKLSDGAVLDLPAAMYRD